MGEREATAGIRKRAPGPLGEEGSREGLGGCRTAPCRRTASGRRTAERKPSSGPRRGTARRPAPLKLEFSWPSQHPSPGDAVDFKIREIRTVAQGRKGLLREREAYSQLMQQGLSNNEACWIVGINAKTGRRWRNGRSAEIASRGRHHRFARWRRLLARPGTCVRTTGSTSPTGCGRPSGDARGPREGLPGPLRPGPGRGAPHPGVSALGIPGQRSAHGPRAAQAPSAGPAAPAPLPRPHGDDQRTPRRGRRPCGPRPLGRGPHHRQGRRLRHRHPRRTQHPLRDAPAPAGRSWHRTGPRRAGGDREEPAGPPGAVPHPGPGGRDGTALGGSPSPPTSRSTSATRPAPGNAAPTRTPMACCGGTSARAPTCPSTAASTWTPSPPNSTAAHAKRSAGKPQPSARINCSRPDQPTTCCDDP
jgi:hypothetical protein